ncbi:hypothetical protein QQ045_001533 [Rhodiola kirilowii]
MATHLLDYLVVHKSEVGGIGPGAMAEKPVKLGCSVRLTKSLSRSHWRETHPRFLFLLNFRSMATAGGMAEMPTSSVK